MAQLGDMVGGGPLITGNVAVPDPEETAKRRDVVEAASQQSLAHGPATRGFGYCCQIFEMGDFARILQASQTLSVTDGKLDSERLLELATQSIIKKCEGYANLIATTEPEQKVAAKALAKAGFKKIGSFPGVRDRKITLWLKAREVIK